MTYFYNYFFFDPDLCQSRPNGDRFNANIHDPGSFIQCSNGRAIGLRCPSNLVFNNNIQVCVRKVKATATTTTTTPAPTTTTTTTKPSTTTTAPPTTTTTTTPAPTTTTAASTEARPACM